jgi:hypothetical protein
MLSYKFINKNQKSIPMNLKNKFFLNLGLAALLVVFNACEKDPDGGDLIAFSAGNVIVGMTGETYSFAITSSSIDVTGLQFTEEIIDSPVGSSPAITLMNSSNATFSTSVEGFYRVAINAEDMNGNIGSDTVDLYIGGVLPTSLSSNTTLPDLFEDEMYPDYYAVKTLQATAGLVLEPGVVLECGPDVRLWFSGNSSYITAQGTAEKNIIIRGTDKVPGSWRAIEIISSNVNNALNYVQIMHAGSSETSGEKTAILLKSNVAGKLSIKNTSISESGGYALYVDGNDGVFTEFENNNFSNNTGAPMLIGAESLLKLDNNSVYTGNGIQAIEVSSGTNVRFNNTGTIKKVGVPYHFYSSAELRSVIAIEAGVTMLFNAGLRFWVTSDGAVIAEGTASENITFSGLSEAPGAWNGFEIASPSVENRIDYGVVSFGGNSGGRGANIYMFGSSPGSQLTITNSKVSDSQTYGIYGTSGTVNLTESGNTFSNNASGNIFLN